MTQSDESGGGIFPAAPPLAVTRMADLEQRLVECEDALRFTEEENARLNDVTRRLRVTMRECAAKLRTVGNAEPPAVADVLEKEADR